MQNESGGKRKAVVSIVKKKEKLCGFCHPEIQKMDLGKGETFPVTLFSHRIPADGNICSGNFMFHISSGTIFLYYEIVVRAVCVTTEQLYSFRCKTGGVFNSSSEGCIF